MNQSFRAEERLHDGRDYGRVFHRQQKAAGKHIVVLMRKRQHGPARLGILVSLKVSKSAVRRHQLKRWAREAFRLKLKAALAGYDVVVLFRSDPIEWSHQDFDRELARLADIALHTSEKQGQPRGAKR